MTTRLCVWRVVDEEILIQRPVEPSHEEYPQGQSVGDQHEVGLVGEPPCVDVPDHVIPEQRMQGMARCDESDKPS